MTRHLAFLVFTALCTQTPQASSAAAGRGETRAWTLADIVEAPAIEGVAISRDGSAAVYALRRTDLQKNRKVSELYLVPLAGGTSHRIYQGAWASELRTIPGSADWSVLADTGSGVQLYRIDLGGRLHLAASSPRTAVIGETAGSVGSSVIDPPQRFGVVDYGWSPDGKSLWYTTVKMLPDTNARLLNDDVLAQTTGARSPSLVELHVAWSGKPPVLVDRFPTALPAGPAGSADIRWRADARTVQYVIDAAARQGRFAEAAFIVDPSAPMPKRIDYQAALGEAADEPIGVFGGRLATAGWGAGRRLVETLPDGTTRDHGAVAFVLDSWFGGGWRTADGNLAIVGVRHLEGRVRSGLARITRRGVEAVPEPSGLTNCAFTPELTAGVCVRQSMTSPPELVRIDPARGGPTPIADLAPQYAAIAPLRVEPRTWKSRLGHDVTGFVVFPRGYAAGKRYPAIVVTHGVDADERFVAADFQWEYPVQVWAERGYVVICVNDPSIAQSQDLGVAYRQWQTGSGPLTPAQIQERIWLDGVGGMENAVADLTRVGIVDDARVGIAGYSRGSQMVNVAMTQSSAFRAASSGDGGYLEPSGYAASPQMAASYRPIYGGSPFDPAFAANWRRLAPTFRASLAAGPILQQIADPSLGRIDFYSALKDAGMPTEITLYPGEHRLARETHLFHIPANRLAAMEENIDWFDFWLLGKEDADPAKADRYKRWRALRAAWRSKMSKVVSMSGRQDRLSAAASSVGS